MAKNRIEVITSVERRRRWSAGERARLLAAIGEPGAVVSEIARDAGVDVSLLYRWRRQVANERTVPAFVPMQVAPEPGLAAPMITPDPPALSAPASIVIAIGAQVRVTVEGAPDAATLTRVIGTLTARDRRR